MTNADRLAMRGSGLGVPMPIELLRPYLSLMVGRELTIDETRTLIDEYNAEQREPDAMTWNDIERKEW